MFEPLNKSHAISETAFYFEFPNIQLPTLQTMLAAHSKVRKILPRNDPMNGMVFEQSGNGFSMNPLPGAEWKHFKSDGNPDWIARITPNSVSVHCLDYTRWTEVWPKAAAILNTIFAGIKKQAFPLINVGLRYVDQFNFVGDLSDYNVPDLLREQNTLVAQKLSGAGTKWHNYIGWFEYSENLEREVLQQLNIDAIEHLETHTPIVSITHASVLRANNQGELENLLQVDDIRTGALGSFMEIAHQNNQRVLRDLLTDNILQKIDLKVSV